MQILQVTIVNLHLYRRDVEKKRDGISKTEKKLISSTIHVNESTCQVAILYVSVRRVSTQSKAEGEEIAEFVQSYVLSYYFVLKEKCMHTT